MTPEHIVAMFALGLIAAIIITGTICSTIVKIKYYQNGGEQEQK